MIQTSLAIFSFTYFSARRHSFSAFYTAIAVTFWNATLVPPDVVPTHGDYSRETNVDMPKASANGPLITSRRKRESA